MCECSPATTKKIVTHMLAVVHINTLQQQFADAGNVAFRGALHELLALLLAARRERGGDTRTHKTTERCTHSSVNSCGFRAAMAAALGALPMRGRHDSARTTGQGAAEPRGRAPDSEAADALARSPQGLDSGHTTGRAQFLRRLGLTAMEAPVAAAEHTEAAPGASAARAGGSPAKRRRVLREQGSGAVVSREDIPRLLWEIRCVLFVKPLVHQVRAVVAAGACSGLRWVHGSHCDAHVWF